MASLCDPMQFANTAFLFRTSLVVWWLRLSASTAGGTGFFPSQGSPACCVVRPKSKTLPLHHIFNKAIQNTQKYRVEELKPSGRFSKTPHGF